KNIKSVVKIHYIFITF
ncbi:alcohol dehydrogenase, partial [Bacillus thuringiensis]|nr:alcohol dehydrogenase [Bacillus thuringiensis]